VSDTRRETSAWNAVRVFDLLDRLEQEVIEPALATLADADPRDYDAWLASLSSDAVATLREQAKRLDVDSDIVYDLIDGLPLDGFELTYDAVVEGARAVLDDLSIDAEQVLLAARVLRFREGASALAEGLGLDHYRAWHNTTVMDVLGALTDSDSDLVGQIVDEANVSATDEFAAMDRDAAKRLADALKNRASGAP
jgi:hypothetical protein